MKKALLIVLLIYTCATYAQISISRNEIPDSVGYNANYLTSALVPVNLGIEGGPQRWDFSEIPFTATSDPFEILSPNVSPWNSSFNWGTAFNPRYATMVQSGGDFLGVLSDSANIWSYYRITTTAYEMLGYGIQGDLIVPEQAVKPSTATRVMQIPLNFNSAWFDSFKAIIDIPDTGSVDLKLKTNLRIQNNVDAFGFLVCPQDSANVLRQVTVVSGNVQIGTLLFTVFIPLMTQEIPSYTQVSYVAENKGILVSATSDTGITTPNFTVAATLRQYGQRVNQIEPNRNLSIPSQISLSVSPNPFNPTTMVSFSSDRDEQVVIDVFDSNGRSIEKLFSGFILHNKKYRMPLTNLSSNGVFFVRMQSETQQKSVKLVKIH